MHKKAIIIDLDNTIYPVSSIGEKLFAPILKLVEETGKHTGDVDKIKRDIMRKPFQVVAKAYGFSEELTEQGVNMLKEITYNEPIKTFPDYEVLKQVVADKFLLTTGFKKMQQSKIQAMNLEQDFKEIHIIDPMVSNKTKKDVIREIIEKYGYHHSEVLVIGDDPDSEIKAAQELGIDCVLYDKYNEHASGNASYKISDFKAFFLQTDLLTGVD